MTNEQLLAEIEDLIRNVPPRETIRDDNENNLRWFGRLSATIRDWDSVQAIALESDIRMFHGGNSFVAERQLKNIMTLMFQCQNDLRMKTVGPIAVAVGTGMVFDYFDEVRKLIESAQSDLLFIDPYLDAEFVSRYLVCAHEGVNMRLLTGNSKLTNLAPAVELFNKQNSGRVALRVSEGLHDRFVIVDGSACYQSGASFKDGAKNSPTTLTGITDTFSQVHSTYEDLWSSGKEII